MGTLLGILLTFTSFFMIVLVLIQRGRGGGLAGALGGAGGQSAFGTKAGDLFTRITMGVATVWILLCIVSYKVLTHQSSPLDPSLGGSSTPAASATPGGEAVPTGPLDLSKLPATGTPAKAPPAAPAGGLAPAAKPSAPAATPPAAPAK